MVLSIRNHVGTIIVVCCLGIGAWFGSASIASLKNRFEKTSRVNRQIALCSKLIPRDAVSEPAKWVDVLRQKIIREPSVLSQLLAVADGPYAIQSLTYDESIWLMNTSNWAQYFESDAYFEVYRIASNLVNAHPGPVDQFYILMKQGEFIDLARKPLVAW